MERRTKKRYSATETAAKLEEAGTLTAAGQTQNVIAKALGISVMTLHRWRRAQHSRSPSLRSRPAILRAPGVLAPAFDFSESNWLGSIAKLRLQNTRLRKIVTELLLERMELEDCVHRLDKQPAKATSR
jgi:putative transposase